MAAKTPIRTVYDGSTATGLAEFQDGEFIAVEHGGTGQATLTANSILVGNGTSAITNSTIQISGNTISSSDASTITINDSLSVSGNITATGNITANGDITIGDSASDTVTITADVSSNLIPSADSTYSLGASGSAWTTAYINTVNGNLTGNVTGNLSGNVTGDLTGDVTGNLTGNVTGNLTGNVTGNINGGLSGDFDLNSSNITGTGSITHTGNITTTGNITLTGELNSGTTRDLIPTLDSQYDLGTSLKAYANAYVDNLYLLGTAVSASAAEINILDGATVTTAELNLLDGVTATTTELNYVDGVTSNIQTQIDNISTSFTLSADSGTNDTFTTGSTLSFTGGTGVTTTVSNDTITYSIGQSVGTADDVTFNSVTGDGSGLTSVDADTLDGFNSSEFLTTTSVAPSAVASTSSTAYNTSDYGNLTNDTGTVGFVNEPIRATAYQDLALPGTTVTVDWGDLS